VKFSARRYDVGYIGRLIKEKGALEFSQSLPLILKEKPAKFIIIGTGYLKDEIEQTLTKNNIRNSVISLDWVDNKILPLCLNDIKMVVVPSHYEGLPNLVLEAMACGTIVLATPVGGLPDVIKDGETGFIMENNSPECIARNVIRVLNHQDLEQISQKALDVIEQGYTYQAAVERCGHIFRDLKYEIETYQIPAMASNTTRPPVVSK
jgi:glycosyltransferase involved in cell wall biosynthesis